MDEIQPCSTVTTEFHFEKPAANLLTPKSTYQKVISKIDSQIQSSVL